MTTLNYKQKADFNPDDYRMTVGEHLEDLRHRLMLGLGAYVVAFAICLALHLPQDRVAWVTKAPTTGPTIPIYHGNPPPPLNEGQMWVDQDLRRLKIYFGGQARTINFMPSNLAAPLITLPQYIDMVINM